jgi:hypothetical protein
VLAAAPARQVGIASAINNDIARIAGLLAVAVLPGLAGITPESYAHPSELSAGFHNAVLIAGGLCAFGGVLSALLIRNRDETAVPPEATPEPAPPSRCSISVPSPDR